MHRGPQPCFLSISFITAEIQLLLHIPPPPPPSIINQLTTTGRKTSLATSPIILARISKSNACSGLSVHWYESECVLEGADGGGGGGESSRGYNGTIGWGPLFPGSGQMEEEKAKQKFNRQK